MHSDLHDSPAAGGRAAAPVDRSSVTILMATYNGERHIRPQLESLLRQTRLPSEILIVDDASTDGTVAAAHAALSTRGIPYRVHVNRQRVGPWNNFLRGLEDATSSIVAFCDQDDVWSEKKLELCVERLLDPGVLLVLHNAMLTDDDLHHLSILDQQIERSQNRAPLTLDPYVGPTAGWGNCMMFKREVAALLPAASRPHQPGEDRLLSHDTWIYVLCAALGQVAQLAEPLTFYRQHGGNVTASARPMRIQLADHFADPSPIYRRRARFYEECRFVFSALAANTDVAMSWKIAAARAERRYAARVDFWNARVATYTAPGIFARLSAYARVPILVEQTAEFASYVGPISRAKDLANAIFTPLRNPIQRLAGMS